ncbi:MAG: STAS domain-containing protein [Pseudohongiellaceae bacterium]|nr:STAS domain-containing protein [Pseudohongiellaceae bacterium]
MSTTLSMPSSVCIGDAGELYARLLEIFKTDQAEIQLNLEEITRVDTAGVQLLLGFLQEAKQRHIAVELVGNSTELQNAMRVLGLKEQFEAH